MTLRKVSTGDDLEISAEFFNAALDAINFCRGQERMFSGTSIPDLPFGFIKIKNTSGSDLPRYSVLSITGVVNECDDPLDTIMPPIIYSGGKVEDANQIFAILADPLDKDTTGRAVIAGITPAKVNIQSENHQYAEPDIVESGKLKSTQSGIARIIYQSAKSGEAWCLLWLGGNNNSRGYNGSFAVTIKDNKLCVSSGFLNCNGHKYQIVPETKDIPPKSGELCVCSKPDAKGGWTKPEIKITEPGFFAYPIAEITVKNNIVAIRQYPVTVAVLMGSKFCSLMSIHYEQT